MVDWLANALWFLTPLLLISVLVFLLIFVYDRISCKNSSKKPVPGPKYSSVVLYLLFKSVFYRNRGSSMSVVLCMALQAGCGLCLLFEKHRIFQVSFFMKTIVAFFKPETIEVVLSNSTKTNDKATEYKLLHPWLKTGLLTSGGEKWHNRRKLLTPAFHFKILEDFIPIFQEQSAILISNLKKSEHNSWVDIVPLITSCSLDIICETAMGVSIHAQSGGCNEYVQAIHETSQIFFYRAFRPWLYQDFIFNWTSQGINFRKNLEVIHNFTKKVIKEKKKAMVKRSEEKNGITVSGTQSNTRNRTVFLELLLEHSLMDPTFTEEGIMEEVDTFMFEGHDTVSMALSWTLYCIGLYENVQHQVHEELDDIFHYDKERVITREDLTHMKYLECVIKETLRLYPSVPLMGRQVTEKVEVLGYTLEPDSSCAIFPFLLHRDPDSFPNPEKFDPERFFPENCARRHPYAYIPFSAGPRNCIGQKFAMMELKTVIANVLRNFTIISKDARDKVNVTPNLVLRNIDPLRLRFTQRN